VSRASGTQVVLQKDELYKEVAEKIVSLLIRSGHKWCGRVNWIRWRGQM